MAKRTYKEDPAETAEKSEPKFDAPKKTKVSRDEIVEFLKAIKPYCAEHLHGAIDAKVKDLEG